MASYYDLLDLLENATEEDIRKAYRRLAKKYHPDVNKSREAQAHFILIHEAYEVLMDREKRFVYDQKSKATADPFLRYSNWVQEQKVRQEAEARKKQAEFLQRKERLRQSKMYYPYMILLYVATMTVIGISLVVLVACAFTIVWYHVFMFFFLLPFICLAAYVLKYTLDEYRKYKALFV